MRSKVAERLLLLSRWGMRGPLGAIGAVVVALLPACTSVVTPLTTPFVGTWTTTDRDRISFRMDTVVVEPSRGPTTVMGPASCPRDFRFGYSTLSRDAILALIPHQSDLRRKLAGLLVRPDYQVAQMNCDRGFNTYVLLDDRDIVAIYRDGDVAGLDRFTRA